MIVPFKANSLMEPIDVIWRAIEEPESGEYGYWPCCPMCDTILDEVSAPCVHCGQRFKDGEMYD